jgi:hypothetical protein
MDATRNDNEGNVDKNDPPRDATPKPAEAPAPSCHVEIKVRNKEHDTFFKVKSTTSLARIKAAWCDRNGKNAKSVRFLFEGQRVQDGDTPESVRSCYPSGPRLYTAGLFD